MCEQPFSLDVLYQAIEQQIQQHLPGVQTVSFWPDIQNHIPLPAVFLDIGEIEPGQETGSGQTALTLSSNRRSLINAVISEPSATMRKVGVINAPDGKKPRTGRG